MSDNEEIKISIDDDDAEIIVFLQDFGEPVFLGEYHPQYDQANDMPSLNYKSNSPLGKYSVSIGFTLYNSFISALLIDFREFQGIIDTNSLFNKLKMLKSIRELVVLFPEGTHQVDYSELQSLQYLELQAPKSGKLVIPKTDGLEELVVFVIQGEINNFPSLNNKTKLQRLVVPKSLDIEFPNSIVNLKNIVWLEIGNQIKSIPEEVANLDQLIILDIWSHNLTSLPESFGKIPNIRHLTIQAPQLSSLPKSFGELTQLTDLYLWNLPVKTIPKEILELSELKYLWMRNNSSFQGKLEAIPNEIGNLENLVELQLNGNQITKVPDTIGKLKKLENLNLAINQLTLLPDSITKLNQLEKLQIYYNPLDALPEDIGELTALQSLDISDTLVSELPASFSKLSSLTNFEAIGCPIQILPESLTQLNSQGFTNFQISLNIDVESLPPKIVEWLNELENSGKVDETKSIAISRYQPEANAFAQDEMELLEESELVSAVVDTEIRSILKQALSSQIAHTTFENAISDFPEEHVNSTIQNNPNSFYHILEHMRLSLEDIIEYIEDPKYQVRTFPDDYWNDIEGSITDFEETISELKALYLKVGNLIDDTGSDLYTTLSTQPDSGHSLFREILIIIAHNSFHLGQFISMRKSLGIW